MLGEPFLDIVGDKGRDRRGASGEEPQEETDPRAPDHRPPALLDIGPGRHPVLDFHLADGGDPLLHVDHHLADREEPHDHADEIHTGRQGNEPEGQPGRPGQRVLADQGGRESQGHGDDPLQEGAAGEADHEAQSHEHQGEVLRRAEDHGNFCQDRGTEGQGDHAERSRDKRTDGRDGQGRAGLPLLGHLIAVHGRRNGGGLPGDVDDDRRRRSAVHGAVVDRRHHDDCRRRRKDRRQREQDGDPGDGSDAGEHPDQRPDETAHQGPEEILPRQGDRKPLHEIVE